MLLVFIVLKWEKGEGEAVFMLFFIFNQLCDSLFEFRLEFQLVTSNY
jgi:hypothetical protein